MNDKQGIHIGNNCWLFRGWAKMPIENYICLGDKTRIIAMDSTGMVIVTIELK